MVDFATSGLLLALISNMQESSRSESSCGNAPIVDVAWGPTWPVFLWDCEQPEIPYWQTNMAWISLGLWTARNLLLADLLNLYFLITSDSESPGNWKPVHVVPVWISRTIINKVRNVFARHPSNAYIRNMEFLRRSHCFPLPCAFLAHIYVKVELTTTNDTHIPYMQGTPKGCE